MASFAVNDSLLWLLRLRVLHGDAGVCGDDVSDLDYATGYCAVIIAGTQGWDHAAPDVANFGVGEDSLEAEADFNAAFAVLDGEDHDQAAVGAFFTDLPLLFEAIGPIVYIVAVEGLDGDDFDLGVGLGVA